MIYSATNILKSNIMKLLLAFFCVLGLAFISCKESSFNHNQLNSKTKTELTNGLLIDSLIIYQTENLLIKRLSKHIYVHTSFLKTEDFGKVACNGMLVVNENKGVVFDTPTGNKSSLELINFITKELKSEIVAIIPTHFHEDCTGGIKEFNKHNIPTYITKQTIGLLNNNGQSLSKEVKEFEDNLILNLGSKKVYAEYFGEGHTRDNIVGYFPADNAIFGGCLIKSVGANKGYLGDANTTEWSMTVRKIKLKYKKPEIIIPGHGKWGNTELLEYTIKLFD